jgi:hypothetical protein
MIKFKGKKKGRLQGERMPPLKGEVPPQEADRYH